MIYNYKRINCIESMESKELILKVDRFHIPYRKVGF
jgi:hypothetical protein